ncbi:hypothetical protein F4778DRAFT_761235 [Xylariomycetidae sp. FL2044]|nr:hypothetical protein F4778DRAFT_761235 [Xylariomycetidae sp. FL2044]
MKRAILLFFTLFSGALAGSRRFHVPEPARVRDADKATACTSATLETITTINRGNEGIWVVRANISDLNLLYNMRQNDWLENDHQAVLDTCSDICLAGNDTELPGSWLPSGNYYQGAMVNTPGGDPPNHILWQCSCYDRALSQEDLAAGGGVWNNANPGSGTLINRKCD